VQLGGVALEECKCALREHDAEPERRVGRVLLVDVDLPAREAPADEEREEQSGRAGTQDREVHAGILSPALRSARKRLSERPDQLPLALGVMRVLREHAEDPPCERSLVRTALHAGPHLLGAEISLGIGGKQ